MKPTERFSDRVSDYAKYRPSYPEEVLPFLEGAIGLRPGQCVADIGSGTGIFTKQLLDFGLTVHAVEANAPMREAAEKDLSRDFRFRSHPGTAEATGLPSSSVDHIFSAQAFHWFHPDRTRNEWKRILRPGGFSVLLWNVPKIGGSRFNIAYETIKEKYGIDFKEVTGRFTSKEDGGAKYILFGGKAPALKTFPNHQLLDLAGLRGRLLSSSYIPKPDHPNYQPMIEALEKLFQDCQENGFIRMEYATEVFYGAL